MALISLASYPNSRVKPRQATSIATTVPRIVNALGETTGTIMPDGGVVTANGNMELLVPNPDRTYTVLFNNSDVDMVYAYTDIVDMEQNINQIGGFLLKAGCSIDLENKEYLYAKSTQGGTINRVSVSMDIGRG